MDKKLAGLSTRRYAPAGLEPVGEQVAARAASTSKSAVSRRFVAQTETVLAKLPSTDLSGLVPVAFMVDGAGCRVVLCGRARAHPGRNEDPAVAGPGLDREHHPGDWADGRAAGRGLDVTRPALAVLDGSKVLRRAVLDVFDAPVLAHCQAPKLRNVRRQFPQRLRSTVERRIRAAYHAATALAAEAQLIAPARGLDKTHLSAAAA